MRLLLAFILLLQACHAFDDQQNARIENCGSDIGSEGLFLRVEGSQGRLQSNQDFEAYRLSEGQQTAVPVSEKGCVSYQAGETILIRSADQSALVNTSEIAEASTVKLNPTPVADVELSCDKLLPTTINENFRLKDVLQNNVPTELRKAFRVDFSVDGSQSPVLSASLLGYDESFPLFNQYEDGRSFELNIRVTNHLQPASNKNHSCRFKMDRKAPAVFLTVNGRAEHERISWHGTGQITALESEQSLAFASENPDFRSVEFCAQRLNDFFTDEESADAKTWQSLTQTQEECNEFLPALPGQRFVPGDSQGFWALRFRSIDAVGNRSPMQNATVFLKSSDKVSFVKTFALTKVQNAMIERRVLDAMSEALDAESRRLSVPTLYEQNQLKSATHSAALSALTQSGVHLTIEAPEEIIDNCQIGKVTERVYCFGRSTALFTMDREKKTILQKIPLSATRNSLRFLRISSDEKVALVGSHFTLETYDLESGKRIANYELTGEVPFAQRIRSWDLTPDEKQVLVIHDGLKVFRFPELEIVGEHKLPADHGFLLAAIPQSSKAVLATKTGAVQIDYLSGEVSPFFERAKAVDRITVSPDGKTLVTGDFDGNIETYDIVNKKQKSVLGRLQGSVYALVISNDGRRLATAASSGPIVIWNLLSGNAVASLNDVKSPVYSVAFNADASVLAATSTDYRPMLWQLQAPIVQKRTPLVGSKDYNFTWQGLKLVMKDRKIDPFLGVFEASKEQQAFADIPSLKDLIWDSPVWKYFKNIHFDESMPWGPIVAMSDDQSIQALVEGKGLKVIDTKSGQTLLQFEKAEKACRLSTDGRLFFLRQGKDLLGYETQTGRLLWTRSFGHSIGEFHLDPENKQLYVEAGYLKLEILDPETGADLRTIAWQSSLYGPETRFPTFSEATNLFSVTVGATDLHVWDRQTGEKLISLSAITKDLYSGLGRISADGQYLAFIGNDAYDQELNVHLFDLEFQRSIQKLCGYVTDSQRFLACQAH